METALRSDRNFRLYLAARVVSQLGDQLYVFAVSWFVLDLTKSGFHVAALLAVNALAVMAIAPFGGLAADRVSRKKVLVGTDLLQGAVLLALFALQLSGRLGVGALYAGTALLGLCSAVFSPAASAIVPGMVGGARVPQAVAAGQAAANFCTIAGMLLGGALYRLVGIAGVLLLNAASNLASAAMESRLRVAPLPAAAGPNAAPAGASAALRRFAGEMRDGLRQVRADRLVFRLLLVNTAFTLAVLPIAMVYMPFLFNVLLGASPVQGAAAQAATWVGIAGGSGLAARALHGSGTPRRPGSESRRPCPPLALITGGLLVLAAHTLLSVALVAARGLLGPAWTSLAFTLANAVAGAAGAFFIVPVYAVFHAHTVEAFRGRFWGLESALRTAAMCAGYLLAGVLALRLPLTVVFAGVGALLLCLSIRVARLREEQVLRV
jgi:MFS family permease